MSDPDWITLHRLEGERIGKRVYTVEIQEHDDGTADVEILGEHTPGYVLAPHTVESVREAKAVAQDYLDRLRACPNCGRTP